MNTDIFIRGACEEDANAVAHLSTILGYSATPVVVARRLRAVLASEADLMIVASWHGVVVGWLQAHAAQIVESGFRVEIIGLIVAPEQRRRGVGRALVSETERWARAICAETVVARSNVQRVESHLFYPELGYSATKTQKIYRKLLGLRDDLKMLG